MQHLQVSAVAARSHLCLRSSLPGQAARLDSAALDSAFCMGMEPAAKRSRLELVQSSFVFLCTTPKQDGTLWPPKLLKLMVIKDENKVVCDESEPHGSWSRSPNDLTIEFHYNGGIPVKQHIFLPVPGKDAWVQEKPGRPFDHRSILIPRSDPMVD